MFRVFVGLATFLVGCIASASLAPARAGYAPVVVYEVVLPPPPPIVYQVVLPPAAVYYPYPYGHWYGPPHTWYGRPWPAYSRHHHRRYARSYKKRVVRAAAKPDPNWYYCKSYWKIQANLENEEGRFWWPYYNPRPTVKDPCNYQNTKITIKPPPYRAY